MFLVSIQRRHVAYCYEQKDFWYVENISNDERLNLTWEIEGLFHVITLSTYIIWKIALHITPNLSRGTLKIANQSDTLFSRYFFLKTILLPNEKIAFKLADSNQNFKYVTTIVVQVFIFCPQECLKASWFIGYPFSFSKGFLSMSSQKLLPLTPSFFLLRNLQIRLGQSFTIFCMCCLSCAYISTDR